MSLPERKQPKLDPYYQREPHPLPLTRAWMADYKRWAAEGCPTPEEEAARAAGAAPVGPPDLQELLARFGGYDKITPEAWAAYDKAMAVWQRRRRERL